MWRKMVGVDLTVNVNCNAGMSYGVFLENLLHQDFYRMVICIVVTKMLKIKYALVLHQVTIPLLQFVVFKQIVTELKR